MENFISWFEIPAKDFKRGISFYESILGIKIQATEMFGTQMGFLPSDDIHVSGAIVLGDGYKPSTDGITIYLNGGEDLTVILDKVEKNNGKVIVPKTQSILKRDSLLCLLIPREIKWQFIPKINYEIDN